MSLHSIWAAFRGGAGGVIFLFLDASSHLYNQACPFAVGQSVRPSVRRRRFREKQGEINIFEQIIIGGGIQDKSDVITSSYNHLIIMRTHRWPYGPCLVDEYANQLLLYSMTWMT